MPQKIQVFAVMKDFFLPEFGLEETVTSISELKQALLNLNPASESIISSCRFAVNQEFVDESFVFQQHDTISIIPPSSGG